MKKYISVLIAAVFVAVTAYADIKVQGWGRSIAVPIGYDGSAAEDKFISYGTEAITNKSSSEVLTGAKIVGTSDNAGFDINIEMKNKSGTPSADYYGSIWVQPWSFLKVAAGLNFYDYTLSGDAAFGAYNWIRSSVASTAMSDVHGAALGEQLTFGCIAATGGDFANGFSGVEAVITPVPELYIAAALPIMGKATASKEILKKFQLLAGYTIDGIGKVKLGAYGNTKSDETWFLLNAAFDFTLVDSLTASIGGWYATDKEAWKKEARVAVTATYTACNSWSWRCRHQCRYQS